MNAAAEIQPIAATLLTPIESHGGYLVKRDDLADERGVKGGKARTAGVICRHILATGMRGLTFAAARNSATPATVGAVCQAYGVRVCVHTPAAATPLPAAYAAARACGVAVVEHRPGYMSVLNARAREQAARDGYLALGLGLCFPAAAAATALQVANIPRNAGRLVVPVGSGRMLEGIICGMENEGITDVPVCGVCVGKVPGCIAGLTTSVNLRLVSSGNDFNKPATACKIGDIDLNPYYEAKCLPFLQAGDLLWVVAK